MNGNTGWKRYDATDARKLYSPTGSNLVMASRFGWGLAIYERNWREIEAGKMRFAVTHGTKILFRTNSLRRAKRYVLEYVPSYQPWDFNKRGGHHGAMYVHHWFRQRGGTVIFYDPRRTSP